MSTAPIPHTAAREASGFVEGGITAPLGFEAAGVRCGIKKSGLDLALIVPTRRPVSAAGLFTVNQAVAAPVVVSRQHLQHTGGRASAIVANSGCANACTGEDGMVVARQMAADTARALECPPEEVLVASTGVIGVALDAGKIASGIMAAARALNRAGHGDAARAIMTTDPWHKETAIRVQTATGAAYHVGGIAKGSGMIEPRLATMLAFVTTDATVAPHVLQRALREAVHDTFNAITVDGECSTNDTVFALAGGASGVNVDEDSYPAFVGALRSVCRELALQIVRGGEGATRLVTIRVGGARSQDEAEHAARTVANSLLVKTAVHGGDPNWGRIIAAAGRSGVSFDLARAAVTVGPVVLFEHGRPFDERSQTAAEYLKSPEVQIDVDLGTGGDGAATIWTCDLSAEYVRINADYRT